ncbi:single-stranded-DNA-specific exonuclease RecJ [Acetobacteraceae bacterium]|nr:single-stranded-DNA-specific exonuclease RecJ [Acetobacteraceae bacterium]
MLENSSLNSLQDPQNVLGVVQSASGRAWLWRSGTLADPHQLERLIAVMGRESGLGDIACRVLIGRGLAPKEVQGFLDASLRRHLPDPSSLKAMDQAAARLAKAVLSNEKIGIFGDYDVDGACSSALLTQYLRALGLTVFPHIPDRMKEGYGPNTKALEDLAEKGATLVICTDCGTTAHEVLNPFSEKCDLIVLDHHKPEGHFLPNGIVVNPNRLDCTSGQGHLCATGVAFLMIVALRRELMRQNYFGVTEEGKKATGPDLLAYLDVVALATICDVMQLRGVNRAFVGQGLKVLEKAQRPGLAALGEVAGLKKLGHSIACGFALGPRINAGGRIGKSTLGIELLLSETYPDALPLARELDETNAKRQEVEGDILQEAMLAAEKKLSSGRNAVFLYAQGWHPGVVGIVAGRIKEKFNRPVFIGSLDSETGLIKGSARSIEGLDVGEAVLSAVQKKILCGGGGHAMAAGFALHPEQGDAFEEFLDEALKEAQSSPKRANLIIDAVISAVGANVQNAEEIEKLAPFGPGNDEPYLALSNVRVKYAKRIGKDLNTLRVTLEDDLGKGRIKALVFRVENTEFGTLLEAPNRPLIHVAGRLRAEEWRGRKDATFFIEDAVEVTSVSA